jgi:hypothetical protein
MRPTELSTYLRDTRSCTIRIQGAQSVTLHNVYLAANERRAHVLFEIGEGGGNNAPFAYLGIWTHGQGEDECAGKPKYAVDFHLSDNPEWCGGAKIQITNFYYRAYNSSGDATADEGGDAVRPDLNTPWGALHNKSV